MLLFNTPPAINKSKLSFDAAVKRLGGGTTTMDPLSIPLLSEEEP